MKIPARFLNIRISSSSPQVCSVLFILVALTYGAPAEFKVTPLPLPGAHGLVMLDYFAYDRNSRLLWVPAANTGSVDVIDQQRIVLNASRDSRSQKLSFAANRERWVRPQW